LTDVQNLRAVNASRRAVSATLLIGRAKTRQFPAGVRRAYTSAMSTDYIPFISAYCDRWCERCAFTSRCAAYQVECAIAMCGNPRDGLELALGDPAPEPDQEPLQQGSWLPTIEEGDISPAERAEYGRRKRARDAQVEATPVLVAAKDYVKLAHDWVDAQHATLRRNADAVLGEALDVVVHDLFFIAVKLYRALNGRCACEQDGDGEDHAVQNDWNGSAKVALISIERSAAAWRVIAESTSAPETARSLADVLACMQVEVEREFPNARRFVRPGFDEA
jgi:hypothetical protein